MQYAVWKISEDMHVLVDALEAQAVDEYAHKENEIFNYEFTEDKAKYSIIKGNIMKNPDKDLDEVIDEVNMRIDHVFGYIDYENSKCVNHDFGLIDIKLEEPNEKNDIPFAALISSNYTMDNLDIRNKTAFLRYGNLPIPTTIINRTWLLSIDDELNKNEITFENWMQFI
ncbi:hypothetical protein KJB62_10805 [Staphylococcus saprophyticus]|uniref:hypothetical protein n=1 Tax=Staphylococcus saprophyticus TaxID=29385 RepID=UPI001F27225F|nr:hypothetical protein [Staphylococcus saprophyticus]MCE5131880.1 hypothetical protein [Staphylococcus saprophyticus]